MALGALTMHKPRPKDDIAIDPGPSLLARDPEKKIEVLKVLILLLMLRQISSRTQKKEDAKKGPR